MHEFSTLFFQIMIYNYDPCLSIMDGSEKKVSLIQQIATIPRFPSIKEQHTHLGAVLRFH
jgi:hypothetical protein